MNRIHGFSESGRCRRESRLAVDAGPPVVPPSSGVRVRLQEHQQVVVRPRPVRELLRDRDARADPGGGAGERRSEPVRGRERAARKQQVRLAALDAVVVLHQDEVDVRPPLASPERPERRDEAPEVPDVRADRELRVPLGGVRPELSDESDHHVERLELVERPVALVRSVALARASARSASSSSAQLEIVLLQAWISEPVQAPCAEAGTAAATGS